MDLSPPVVIFISWSVLILWVGTSLLGEISSLRELYDDFLGWVDARDRGEKYSIVALGRLLIAIGFVVGFTFSLAVGVEAVIGRLYHFQRDPDPSLYAATLQAQLIVMLWGFYAAKKINRIMRARADEYARAQERAKLEAEISGD